MRTSLKILYDLANKKKLLFSDFYYAALSAEVRFYICLSREKKIGLYRPHKESLGL